MGRWTEPRPKRPYDWAAGTEGELSPLLKQMQETYDATFPPRMRRSGKEIAAFLALVLFIVAAVLTLASLAGAETVEQDCTRPYHNLTVEQLPNICTVQFDGQGHAHLAGYNPDGGLIWHAATFHVPNPDVWDDQTVTVNIILPVGPFNVTLACKAGAAQVDVWLDGHEDAYVADTTLDCDTPCFLDCDTPCFLDIAVPVPDAVPSVSERHDDAPCGVGTPQLGAPSGQTGPGVVAPVLSAATDTTPTDSPPVGVVSSAAETAVAPSTVVSAAAATTALPNTGSHAAAWMRAAMAFLVVGVVLLAAGIGLARKDKRS